MKPGSFEKELERVNKKGWLLFILSQVDNVKGEVVYQVRLRPVGEWASSWAVGKTPVEAIRKAFDSRHQVMRYSKDWDKYRGNPKYPDHSKGSVKRYKGSVERYRGK